MNINDNFQIISESLEAFAEKCEAKATEYGDGAPKQAYKFGMYSTAIEMMLYDLRLTEQQIAQLKSSLKV